MSFADRLGIVCGMQAEARWARRMSADVVCAAGQRSMARLAAAQLLEDGVSALLSFGVAGALAPHLRSGDVIIGTTVLSCDQSWTADSALTSRLRSSVPDAYDGPIWSEGEVIATPASKASLYERTSCLAADQESAGLAEAASLSLAPFAILRVIVDTCDRPLPSAALVPLSEDGRTPIVSIISDIIRNPAQIPSLLHLVGDMRLATRSMQRLSNLIQEV